ncbi:peptidase inhibitor family I36 protein [Cellulomonas sp. SLBN-39]|uniref:peptidase inhibitor family I36 protein n=1 Tax=Cellulomonas sp. SLBN-39 TaxID=2768446 RepID=UPI002101D745|nr:peptidase inhibitor family I36 protein [Cellulomonas sp. SLBN-39]
MLVAPAAQAVCDAGHMCIYVNNDYSGTMRGFSNSKLSWGGFGLDDKASSASANGTSCSKSYYYDNRDWTGDYFYLNSYTITGANYQDPNLSNGAGYGTWATNNANDKISSANFASCS